MENVNCIFVIVCVHYRIHVLIKKKNPEQKNNSRGINCHTKKKVQNIDRMKKSLKSGC